jgi:ribonuclease P protein subunit RPR2
MVSSFIVISADNVASKTHTHMTHYTCLACKAIRSIPNPPILDALSATSTSDSTPIVESDRRPAKVAFHEREEVADHASQNGGGQRKGQVDGKKGHSLWRGDTCLSGWGAVPAGAEAGGPSTT